MKTITNILLVGPEGVGKSLLTKRLQQLDTMIGGTEEPFQNTVSTVQTVGKNLTRLQFDGNAKREFEIREVGGVMAPIWRNFFGGLSACVYVVDAANQFQLSAACILLLDLLTNKKIAQMPILILLNKIDMQLTMSLEEVWQILRLKDLMADPSMCGIIVKECSCLEGTGLDEVKKWFLSIPDSSQAV